MRAQPSVHEFNSHRTSTKKKKEKIEKVPTDRKRQLISSLSKIETTGSKKRKKKEKNQQKRKRKKREQKKKKKKKKKTVYNEEFCSPPQAAPTKTSVTCKRKKKIPKSQKTEKWFATANSPGPLSSSPNRTSYSPILLSCPALNSRFVPLEEAAASSTSGRSRKS
ncbi:hypothetical protein FN846DRAFT_495908 [Sphaerosporella brunnea]|uniref:Uncharacterized protein n=1 Tax=Sphaerosporella brunnea TaxID=1250544 RepID=A0A5J5F427_9PEZI|nr:hypothetical protein FN846DRAFT_495908 [Sphaerosporella brunnea]